MITEVQLFWPVYVHCCSKEIGLQRLTKARMLDAAEFVGVCCEARLVLAFCSVAHLWQVISEANVADERGLPGEVLTLCRSRSYLGSCCS